MVAGARDQELCGGGAEAVIAGLIRNPCSWGPGSQVMPGMTGKREASPFNPFNLKRVASPFSPFSNGINQKGSRCERQASFRQYSNLHCRAHHSPPYVRSPE